MFGAPARVRYWKLLSTIRSSFALFVKPASMMPISATAPALPI